MALCPSSIPLHVPLPAPPKSSRPEVPDLASDSAHASSCTDPSFEGECALGTDVLEDRLEDFECLAAAVPRFDSMLLALEGDPDAPDIPTSRSYAEAITVPPSRANIVDGMWIFRGVDYFQAFSPTPKMTTLWVLLHVASQRDYEYPVEPSAASLRSPPGASRVARHTEDYTSGSWVCPSTADPSLFLRTDTSLPSFYILVYVDDLVFATADTEALTLLKSELEKRHIYNDLGEMHSYLGLQSTQDKARRTITLNHSHMVHQVLQRFGFQFSLPQLTPLSTSHSHSAPPSDESVEPNGPYPELVGCLMHLMTCTRPDLAYPLSLLARYVASVRRAWGLFLEDRVQLSSLVTETPPGSSCEAEIYPGAMAAQELRWLTYLLTDLGEQPRSLPALYVDNKAMIALCQEHRLEHKTKHIALRYFLARELQQRGQLRLAYVATRANTADIFTKALPPGDHLRCATVLGLVPTLPHLLTS
ncbi:unnamed protein product [Closterium sp. NIES-53]